MFDYFGHIMIIIIIERLWKKLLIIYNVIFFFCPMKTFKNTYSRTHSSFNFLAEICFYFSIFSSCVRSDWRRFAGLVYRHRKMFRGQMKTRG